jgi:outer membrane protein assembly factor BamB
MSHLLLAFCFLLAVDTEWSQFRGAASSGVSTGAEAPVNISPSEHLKWSVDLPSGMSSPSIYGDRIFLTGYENDALFTICVDRLTGKELWRQKAPATEIEPYHKTQGSPAASTPAVDAHKVIVYFGSCGLLCYNHDGKELWRLEMPCAHTNNDFGTGTSPILYNNRVILVRDLQKNSAISSIDADTGKVIWKTERDGFQTSWTTPVLWKTTEGVQIVVAGGLRMKAYDFDTGEEIWVIRDCPAVACASPVISGDNLYYAGWAPGNEDFPMPTFAGLAKDLDANKDNILTKEECVNSFLKDFFDSNDKDHDGQITPKEWDDQINYMKTGKNSMFAVKPGGKGDITKTHVIWRTFKGLPYVPMPVVTEDKIFLVKQGGLVTCCDLNGKSVYEQKRIASAGNYYSSPIVSHNHMYLFDTSGVLTVINTEKTPEVVHTAEFNEMIAATPAIEDGVIYVRTNTKLYAFAN